MRQRQIVFALFCLFAAACAVVELYVLVALVSDPSDALVKGFAAVMNGSLLGGVGVLFKRLIDRTFVSGTLAPVASLADLAFERNRILDSDGPAYDMKRDLVTSSLEFAERCIRPWVAGTHFEFCVFVHAEAPLLFAYFDSAGNRSARSMQNREADPDFYVRNGYEVVTVLKERSTLPRVISKTGDASSSYTFATEQQRLQLRSTILMSIDTALPCALVVTSNREDAFSANDTEMIAFLRFVASLARFDLFTDGFVGRLPVLRPDLFPGVPIA